jgi:hypothetical protein
MVQHEASQWSEESEVRSEKSEVRSEKSGGRREKSVGGASEARLLSALVIPAVVKQTLL